MSDRLARRNSRYKSVYGITFRQYVEMAFRQGNKCLICGVDGKQTERQKLSVDHCHHYGEIRGLLCQKCNTGLGLFDDNPEAIIKAAKYLKRFNKKMKFSRAVKRIYYFVVKLSWSIFPTYRRRKK